MSGKAALRQVHGGGGKVCSFSNALFEMKMVSGCLMGYGSDKTVAFCFYTQSYAEDVCR